MPVSFIILNFITIACLLVNNYKLQKVKIRNLNIAYCTVFSLIVVAINDQQNSELYKNEIMLKMCDNTKFKLIPTAKQAIQAIESLRRFTLVMNNAHATGKAHHIGTKSNEEKKD